MSESGIWKFATDSVQGSAGRAAAAARFWGGAWTPATQRLDSRQSLALESFAPTEQPRGIREGRQ